MRHIVLALVLATFATAAIAEGSAPFCTVDASGSHCYYYGIDACRAAAGPSGVCVVNAQRQNSEDPRGFDFSSGTSVLSEMQRWQSFSAGQQSSSSTTRQQRWLDMCRRMEQSYFDDLEYLRPRLSPPMTADEYERASSSFRARGEHCRNLAR